MWKDVNKGDQGFVLLFFFYTSIIASDSQDNIWIGFIIYSKP